ncbi:hypothetical protein FHX82_002285 [Amycolatopsis bartoniae]|uniref:Uncharacterized protein n=1 Tax=Amycolatopsis bartoniae TaxID=941986 RepID=A0A8H9IUN3_9PSEU|nr:hypothetical protein [Amycolatopsis bartoniae]GHF55597.1 hypothetical protein GCM10017566_30780 [Amycolatopsis bartoniae]
MSRSAESLPRVHPEPIELGIVHRLFGQARSAAGEPQYEVTTCALTPGVVCTLSLQWTVFGKRFLDSPERREAKGPSCRSFRHSGQARFARYR